MVPLREGEVVRELDELELAVVRVHERSEDILFGQRAHAVLLREPARGTFYEPTAPSGAAR
ncbi:hypothetical protein GCM10023351_27090 [Microbacterium gilvum]|uniref:Uncharacterized protein n=1 Tax=Microbacterium gilvum TaxID=1336204 RepID=A0ABP9AIZ6_9MICO